MRDAAIQKIKQHKRKYWMATSPFRLLAMTLIIFLFSNQAFAKDEATKKIQNQSTAFYCKQFQDVMQRVDKDYIGEVDYQKMTDEAINGMLQSLDPYSGYFVDDDLEFFPSEIS